MNHVHFKSTLKSRISFLLTGILFTALEMWMSEYSRFSENSLKFSQYGTTESSSAILTEIHLIFATLTDALLECGELREGPRNLKKNETSKRTTYCWSND